MGYDLYATHPKYPEKSEFHMGAFSFPVILEITSGLYPALHYKGQYYLPGNAGESDERFNDCKYPPELANDGFVVTDEEARIMARFCRNWCRVQRSLPEENRTTSFFQGEKGRDGIKREDLEAKLAKTGLSRDDLKQIVAGGPMSPEVAIITSFLTKSDGEEPWPAKVRDDFTDKIEAFADWAEQSGGFEIH